MVQLSWAVRVSAWDAILLAAHAQADPGVHRTQNRGGVETRVVRHKGKHQAVGKQRSGPLTGQHAALSADWSCQVTRASQLTQTL